MNCVWSYRGHFAELRYGKFFLRCWRFSQFFLQVTEIFISSGMVSILSLAQWPSVPGTDLKGGGCRTFGT